MANELRARYGPVYLREMPGGWDVGTADCPGLPVPSFADALAVADCWMRIVGADDCVVVHADGTAVVASGLGEEPG